MAKQTETIDIRASYRQLDVEMRDRKRMLDEELEARRTALLAGDREASTGNTVQDILLLMHGPTVVNQSQVIRKWEKFAERFVNRQGEPYMVIDRRCHQSDGHFTLARQWTSSGYTFGITPFYEMGKVPEKPVDYRIVKGECIPFLGGLANRFAKASRTVGVSPGGGVFVEFAASPSTQPYELTRNAYRYGKLVSIAAVEVALDVPIGNSDNIYGEMIYRGMNRAELAKKKMLEVVVGHTSVEHWLKTQAIPEEQKLGREMLTIINSET